MKFSDEMKFQKSFWMPSWMPKLATIVIAVATAFPAPSTAAAPSASKSSAKPKSGVSRKGPARDVSSNSGKNLPTKLPAKISSKTTGSRSSGAEVSVVSIEAPAAQSVNSEVAAWSTSTKAWTRVIRAADSTQSVYLGEILSLAVDGMYLIAPLDSVSGPNLARGEVRFWVDEPQVEARLVEVDLVANLALFRVDRPLGNTYPRSMLRFDPPSVDETLFSAVSRDWVRGGIRFMRARMDGPTVRYQIGHGQADVMNANLVFDKAGRLIAIGSTQVGNDGWFGSSRSVAELLRRADAQKAMAGATFEQSRHEQLLQWQQRWAAALVSSKRGIALNSMECRPHLTSVSDGDLAAKIQKVRSLKCENYFPLALGGGYAAGIQILTGEVVLTSRDVSSEDLLTRTIASQTFEDHSRSSSLVNLMTVADCQEREISNQAGHQVRVRYCTSALKSNLGLNDTAISVSSMETPNRAFVTVARLKGFGATNTKKILEALIENVRSLK